MTVVVATCLLNDSTEVLVLDPPPDKPDDEQPGDEASERVSERTGKRSWRISNPEAFHERTVVAEESNLMKWAGQYQTATVRDRRLERTQPELIEMPNAPLETKRTNVGIFRGMEQPLFPALGVRNVRIFTGVEDDLLESLIHERPRAQGGGMQAGRGALERQQPDRLPATVSVSPSGSCMIIEGL